MLVSVALLLAIFGCALIFPRGLVAGPNPKPWAVGLLFVAVGLIVFRYLCWRLTSTFPEAGAEAGQVIFFWTLLTIETAVWIDTIILFSTLLRRRDNSGTADEGEARLKAMPADDLPSIDVFIATYNEDINVLEKTIIGASALDWPKSRLRVCILDDSNRTWLRDYCSNKGVDYFTREGNADAKAGNINAAIARTSGNFFMVLDADFIPRKNFLLRAMGLFDDPSVGIVQIPHSFYNSDPMQANLNLRDAMPDDQRLFFGDIMPGRDGWNAAFCCGSNSITRRTAIEEIGNRLPSGSITEDMLLTMALLRKGYVTRYLNERLATGLAPESLQALYVQRARWARGAIQILFLRDGPFGRGLSLVHRLMFLPLHWIIQPFMVIATLITPAICLWTGWTPFPGAKLSEIFSVQMPAVAVVLVALRLVSPGGFFPLASTVHAALMSVRILPVVITTFIKPHGHVFKVTPKGHAAGAGAVDRTMIFAPAILILITALGLYLNTDVNTRILATPEQLPLTALWAVMSMIILSIVQVVAIAPPGERTDDYFPVDEACLIIDRAKETVEARLLTLALSGAKISFDTDKTISNATRWVRLEIEGIGRVAAHVSGRRGRVIDVTFRMPDQTMRERLIEKLYTRGLNNSTTTSNSSKTSFAMIFRSARRRSSHEKQTEDEGEAPSWTQGETS